MFFRNLFILVSLDEIGSALEKDVFMPFDGYGYPLYGNLNQKQLQTSEIVCLPTLTNHSSQVMVARILNL